MASVKLAISVVRAEHVVAPVVAPVVARSTAVAMDVNPSEEATSRWSGNSARSG